MYNDSTHCIVCTLYFTVCTLPGAHYGCTSVHAYMYTCVHFHMYLAGVHVASARGGLRGRLGGQGGPGAQWPQEHRQPGGRAREYLGTFSWSGQVRYNESRAVIATSGVEKVVKLWSCLPLPECQVFLCHRELYSFFIEIRVLYSSGVRTVFLPRL